MSSDSAKSADGEYQDEKLILTDQDIKQMVENDRKIPFTVHETGIRYTVEAELIDDE